MANRQSGSTTGMAVVAVIVVLGAVAGFFYKTVVLDSRGPAGASASTVAAPLPSASITPADASAGEPPAAEAPRAGGAASGGAASGGAASSVGRAVSGVAKVVTGQAKQSQEDAERLSALLTS